MRRMKGGYPGLKWRSQNISDMSKNAVHITFKSSQKICTFLSFSSENCCYTAVKVHIPYSLDQTPSSNGRRTQIDAASFTYLSFIVSALELSPHILIRAHLPRRCPRACDTLYKAVSLTVRDRYIKRLVKLLTKADSDKQCQTLS